MTPEERIAHLEEEVRLLKVANEMVIANHNKLIEACMQINGFMFVLPESLAQRSGVQQTEETENVERYKQEIIDSLHAAQIGAM